MKLTKYRTLWLIDSFIVLLLDTFIHHYLIYHFVFCLSHSFKFCGHYYLSISYKNIHVKKNLQYFVCFCWIKKKCASFCFIKNYSLSISVGMNHLSIVRTLYGGSALGASSTYAICTPLFASSSAFI